jgi:uncharacterized damage-inducible protein DinB
MGIETLRTLFSRDLNNLKKEIEGYQNDENLWAVTDGISNSGGNLCLHLIGNLNHFIGAELGKTGYVRQRKHEFSKKNVPKTALLTMIKETMTIVDKTLQNLDSKQLDEEYPILVFKEKTTTGYFLTHLATHLAYHLGQVNYHRRLLDRT